ASAEEPKNRGPDAAHQRRNDRDTEENCKAAANTLRKIRKAPGEKRSLNRVPRRETTRSNASFETKHRLPAEFQGLPSWGQSVAYETWFCENKIARRFCSPSWWAVYGPNAGATPPATVPIPPGIRSGLVNAENVRVACSDLPQV